MYASDIMIAEIGAINHDEIRVYFCDTCFKDQCSDITWGYTYDEESGPTDHNYWDI